MRAKCDLTYGSLACVKIALFATSEHSTELIVGLARDRTEDCDFVQSESLKVSCIVSVGRSAQEKTNNSRPHVCTERKSRRFPIDRCGREEYLSLGGVDVIGLKEDAKAAH